MTWILQRLGVLCIAFPWAVAASIYIFMGFYTWGHARNHWCDNESTVATERWGKMVVPKERCQRTIEVPAGFSGIVWPIYWVGGFFVWLHEPAQ